MRIGDKFKKLNQMRKATGTFKKLAKSKDKIAGMSLVKFVQKIRKNPENTLMIMSNEEFDMLFSHPSAKDMFNAIPGFKKVYDKEVERRNQQNSI